MNFGPDSNDRQGQRQPIHPETHQPLPLRKQPGYYPGFSVGIGAAGGVLLQRLARAGFEVVGMEAGPFWDTERDWVSDEVGSHQLYWKIFASQAEKILSLSAPTIAAKVSEAGPCTGQRSLHVFTRRTLKSTPVTALGRIGQFLTGT
jgi:hypothetical protein